MPEDKATLEEWLADMKILSNQSKEIDMHIEAYTQELELSKREKEENTLKREAYAQKILGRSGSDEEIFAVLRNKLQEVYQQKAQGIPKDKDTLKKWFEDVQGLDMEQRLGWRIGDRKWNIYKTPEDRERQKIKCAAELDSYSQKIFGKSVPNDQLIQTLGEALQKEWQKETISLLSEYEKLSMPVRLSYKSKTTDILDDFHDSKKKFLIFQELCRFYDPDSGRYAYIDLIVSEESDCPYKETSCPTMTEIKNISDLFITPGSLDVPQRLIPLVEEIIKVVRKHRKIETPFTSVFWKPFELGGISYSDRYWMGMPVGEVSSYYAVGITVKEKLWGID